MLHREVAILEDLVFRLVKTILLLEAREARFLGLAIDEINDRVAVLGEVELARALAAHDATSALGLDADASLSDLVAHAEPEFRGALGKLQSRLRTLNIEVQGLTRHGAMTLRTCIDEVRAAVSAIHRLDIEGDHSE